MSYITEDQIEHLRNGWGCQIDNGCWIGDSVYFDPKSKITLGDSVVISCWVRILTHDAAYKMFGGGIKIGEVKIGNKVFIGACSIILPGVMIGDNVIIGAGSVVIKNLESGFVYAGNPAKKIKQIVIK